jgi:carbamoyl-phosphate synthase large subunit
MPRRDDLESVLVLGSGPIVIGQAGEFDYSGTQACRALRSDGYRVVLVNSNPATIMTDPEVADRTYVEPLDLRSIEAIIAREHPDALLPTLGGQTALNLAMELERAGILERFGVELIGATAEAIHRAEDRDAFRETMRAAGLEVPRSVVVTSLEEGRAAVEELGLPVILRPGFTLGGHGGGVARSMDELERRLSRGLDASPISQVLVEESVLGWGEFELEVMRDGNDNAVIVCSIENVDPMGVHTGDSVTVAPAMTLSDTELQDLRDATLAVVRAIGVETGGANVQFALNRETGRLVVIEMNPRVSRSSALASKATGFPIAKLAARLAVGYTLDELPNEITQVTPASFEPTLDYVALKAPRFAFEKIPGADATLTTHMKSVGEVLTLGRTFIEAFAKAQGGRELDVPPRSARSVDHALELLAEPSWDRYDLMVDAIDRGAAIAQIVSATGVHEWFVEQIAAWVRARAQLPSQLDALDTETIVQGRRNGLGDVQLAEATGATGVEVARHRDTRGIRPTFHAVDTCAAEFAARTPYFYSAYDTESEVADDDRDTIVVLGSGPNRIGQGIEFDYCCVHAVQTARELGYAAVMVNCNPETVSTDHGVSDRLYLETVTLDAVLDICQAEQPRGVITQLGGQTPLRLAASLAAEGVPLLGTSPAAIDLAEDRGRFGELLQRLGLRAPPWEVVDDPAAAPAAAERVGYPALVRPSYVLGGRGMRVCYSPEDLAQYLADIGPQQRLLIDRFLENAVEFDVDALCDGERAWAAGVMEHIEAAGVHSGDSACVLPPVGVGPGVIDELERQTCDLAIAVGAVGLVNAQFAVKDGDIFVIEANPRASRTVPFVAKATGVPLVAHAVRLMLGARLADLDLPSRGAARHVAVKEAVLPFDRFPDADPVLGPEMRATGEAMALAGSLEEAFAKAQRGAGQELPTEGTVFISARDRDKARAVGVAGRLARAGLELCATEGTAAAIRAAGVPVQTVAKLGEGSPDAVGLVDDGEIAMVLNMPSGGGARTDGGAIRRAAIRARIPCITSIQAAEVAASTIASGVVGTEVPIALQDIGSGAEPPRLRESSIARASRTSRQAR